MFTAVVAWLAVLAVCVAAVLLGKTASTTPRRRRRSRAARIGLFVSLSGPGLMVLAGAVFGLVTGAWLAAAAGAACGIVLVALVGLALRPR